MQKFNTVKSSELRAGMIVHFMGARFRLRDDFKKHPSHTEDKEAYVYTITGDWIDGAVQRGYFGPETPWHFQGNDLATRIVEV